MTGELAFAASDDNNYLLVVADRSERGREAMAGFCSKVHGLAAVLETWPEGADFVLLTIVGTAAPEGTRSANIAFADLPNLGLALESIRDDHLGGRGEGVMRAAVSADVAGEVDRSLAPFRPGQIALQPGSELPQGHIGIVVSIAGHPSTMCAFSPPQIAEIERRLARRLGVAPEGLVDKEKHGLMVDAFKAMSVEKLPEYERSYALCSLGAALVMNHPREASAFRAAISHQLRGAVPPYMNIGLDGENAISYSVGALPGNLLEVHRHLREAGSLAPGFSGIDVACEKAPPSRLN